MSIYESLVSIRELASTKTRPGLVKISRSAIYDMAKRGDFPAPIKLSPRKSFWDVRVIEAWLEGKARGDTQ